MSSELMSAMTAAATGLRAQTVRIRISAEKLDHADSTSAMACGDPYLRKAPVFRTMYDRAAGVDTVKVTGTRLDQAPFQEKYDPSHPAANSEGYVKLSNV